VNLRLPSDAFTLPPHSNRVRTRKLKHFRKMSFVYGLYFVLGPIGFGLCQCDLSDMCRCFQHLPMSRPLYFHPTSRRIELCLLL
jgi:hypothetical protein